MKFSFAKSILFKTVIAFLLITIPFGILAIIITGTGEKIAKQEATNVTMTNLHAYKQITETEIYRINDNINSYVGNSNLQYLGAFGDIIPINERVGKMMKLQKDLAETKYVSPYISEIFVYFPKFDQMLQTYTSQNYIDKTKYNSILTEVKTSTSPLIQVGDEIFCVHFPFNQINSRRLNYLIAAKIDKEMLSSSLSNLSQKSNEAVKLYNNRFELFSSEKVIDNELYKKTLSKINTVSNANDLNSNSTLYEIDNKYFVYGEWSAYLKMNMVAVIPLSNEFGKVQFFRAMFYALAGAFFLLVLIFFVIAYKMIHKPINIIFQALENIENGRLEQPNDENISLANEFAPIYQRVEKTRKNLKNYIASSYEQQILLQKSEYKNMQNQIKPHFLFNSLYALYRMIEDSDNQNASRFSLLLSSYYKFLVRDNADYVTLSQEIEYMNTFIEIQKIHYGKRFEYIYENKAFDLPKSQYVPKLVLQPLVENAFKYAFSKTAGICILQITIEQYDDILKILVEDNGNIMTEKDYLQLNRTVNENQNQNTEHALRNINKRIQISCGFKYGLTFYQSSLGGLSAQALLPLHPLFEKDYEIIKQEDTDNV